MGFISCAQKYPVSTFRPKNPVLQDSILIFNQDCELVSQLPTTYLSTNLLMIYNCSSFAHSSTLLILSLSFIFFLQSRVTCSPIQKKPNTSQLFIVQLVQYSINKLSFFHFYLSIRPVFPFRCCRTIPGMALFVL